MPDSEPAAQPDYEQLSRAHKAQQVNHAAITQVALAQYWDQIIDPADFEGSFERFLDLAVTLVGAGRIKSEDLAMAYYDELKRLAGLEGPLAEIAFQALKENEDATRAAIAAAVEVDATQQALEQGAPPNERLEKAKSKMLGSAKRRVLDSGRQYLIKVSAADPELDGWSRVGDGDPCSFCAMLVSRGPVYTAETVHFHAHDKCGCSVRPITKNDRTRGWTGDARYYNELWQQSHGDEKIFRSAMHASTDMVRPSAIKDVIHNMKDPSSPVVDRMRDRLYATTVAKQGARAPASALAPGLKVPDGGFTFDPAKGELITAGFGVSPYPERSKLINIKKMSDDDIMGAIHDFSDANHDVLSKPGNYVGGWHDPAHEGDVYLDVSIVTDTATEARKVGAKKDQIAFYDFQDGESVTINKDAKSGQG